jgi:hypothetical protein
VIERRRRAEEPRPAGTGFECFDTDSALTLNGALGHLASVYHLENPILALRNMASVSTSCLVETTVCDSECPPSVSTTGRRRRIRP